MEITLFGFKKEGYSAQSIAQPLSKVEIADVLASPLINERLDKFAKHAQRIAPKSDDFLYFTIIFLKAAESCLIDDIGNLKKVGKENAWGHFDDNWKWHGNIKPHKNSNSDIFPESELRIAARKWIGSPLCVDHKSESVDGIRGIVLDTHYDEKLKQVVGLCALDRINYPDLARKVQTGVVRFGSMGTGVETSVCTECSQKAKAASEYCACILEKRAYGEINVGLRPIEYSLVVQPAEPGAILLRVIASIKTHEQELNLLGVEDLDVYTSNLPAIKASELDLLLHKACGENGCSIPERKKIISAFLTANNFTKTANDNFSRVRQGAEALAELARAKEVLGLEDSDTDFMADELINSIKEVSMPEGETLTSGQSSVGSTSIITKDDQGVSGNGTESSGLMNSDSGELNDSFDTGGVGPESYLTRIAGFKQNKLEISSIMEDIMKEKELRQRANERRKIAYHFGGAHPKVEPDTYKSEDYKKYWEMDKQMHANPKKMGDVSGMVPGDKEIKEKQSRAEDRSERMNKEAYHFGGAHPKVEPDTFKSEDYKKYWNDDKQMHLKPAKIGPVDGAFPGDKEIKEKQSRASYNGPKLSTKFRKLQNLDGSINKAASCFEVYGGDNLLIAATARDIMGPSLEQEWEWMTSKDYAKAVVAAIRQDGLEKVATALLGKTAQALPEMPATPAPEEMGAPAPGMDPMSELPEMDAELPATEVESTPKAQIEDALVSIEDRIEEMRSALEKLGGGEDVDINVNVGGEEVGEKVALSRRILSDLKLALAESNESADELAKISESLDKAATLPKELRRDLMKVSHAALMDSSELLGETAVLLKMATQMGEAMVKTSSYVEEPVIRPRTPAKIPAKTSNDNELVKEALALRKSRREAFLKKAEEEEAQMKEEEDKLKNEASDGVGMWENAGIAGVAKDTAEDVANKAPKAPAEHSAAPHTGNADAKQKTDYGTTPSRQLAEKSNSASDAALDKDEKDEVKDIAKDKVEGHEGKMHDKESDAMDQVKASLNRSVLEKKAEEERTAYRVKVRRALDVALDMQRKGMIAGNRASLDQQVDLMLEFDDKAFESWKRTVANTRSMISKTASQDVTLNVGITENEPVAEEKTMYTDLASIWSKK